MISSIRQEKTIKKALDLGAKGYILKPFGKENLKKEINKAMSV